MDPIEPAIRRLFGITEDDIDSFNELSKGHTQDTIPKPEALMRQLLEGTASKFLQQVAAKTIYGLYVELSGKAMSVTKEALVATLLDGLIQQKGGVGGAN